MKITPAILSSRLVRPFILNTLDKIIKVKAKNVSKSIKAKILNMFQLSLACFHLIVRGSIKLGTYTAIGF